ncbi:HET-domain-containing protein [Byssothecium circinans]|uniref:HET-domain-containing protein n=1 Tax=Byssothecium circinans TaxID=147558 RepID=A0A6A5TDN9_9PLEO|nr:HET-domain-containing protein [Byssothecium circinans]
MATPSIHLTNPSSFCPICCNLSPLTIHHLIPRSDIICDTNRGVLNVALAKKNNLYDFNEDVPSWAGRTRFDYCSFRFLAALGELVRSGETGCATCGVLSEGVGRVCDGVGRGDREEVEVSVEFCRGDVVNVEVYRVLGGEEGDDVDDLDVDIFGDVLPGVKVREWCGDVDFYTLRGPWPTIGSTIKYERPSHEGRVWVGGQTRHIAPTLSISAATTLVKRWIDKCTSTHTHCNATNANHGSLLPKRVLAVGNEDNKGIHLFETSTPNTPHHTGPYIALSHCWGQSQHLTSTQSTVQNWKQNIPWDRLPRTFQDAIATTRSLGIPYIWIDSLCIIQDSATDWEAEAAKMGAIYNRAFLVISATSSVDGDGGLFFQRPSHVTITGVDGSDPSNAPFEIYARKYIGHIPFRWGPDAEAGSPVQHKVSTYALGPEYPLLTRAWCFQERLLGTKVLHFTRSEVVFECLTAVDCECGAMTDYEEEVVLPLRRHVASKLSDLERGHMDRYKSNDSVGFLQSTEIRSDLAASTLSPKDGFIRWRNLVAEYSAKSITHRKDWLPALAGLASKWHREASGVYFAGVWSRDVLRSLLWAAVYSVPDKSNGMGDMYIAPSWSWASIGREVSWIPPADDFFVDVDEDKSATRPKTHDVFGAVTGGWLHLTGLVAEAKLCKIHPSGPGERSYLGVLEANQEKEIFHVDDLKTCEQEVGSNVLWMKLCEDGGHERALILARVTDERLSELPEEVQMCPMVCRRIGIVQYVNKDFQYYLSEQLTKATMYVV